MNDYESTAEVVEFQARAAMLYEETAYEAKKEGKKKQRRVIVKRSEPFKYSANVLCATRGEGRQGANSLPQYLLSLDRHALPEGRHGRGSPGDLAFPRQGMDQCKDRPGVGRETLQPVAHG